MGEIQSHLSTVLRRRAGSARMLYLVLVPRHPNALPPSPLRALNARFYPALAQAALIVPLNAAYLRATPAKAMRLLDRIRSVFTEDLRARDIPVDAAIREI